MPIADDATAAKRRTRYLWTALCAVTLMAALFLWRQPGAALTGSAPDASAAAGDGFDIAAVLLVAAVVAGLGGWLLLRLRGQAATARLARNHLQALAEVLDVWQWRTDAEHRIVFTRPPAGAPSADWAPLPATPALWECFRADDEPALRARMKSGAALDELAVWRTAADGSSCAGQLRGRAIADAAGSFAGYVGTLRDKAADIAAAPPANAASRINTTASGLPPTAAGLESDNEYESFSYTVSHDLRAPIRVVEGFTKMLKEDYAGVLDQIGNDHLDRVLGAAARMNNMIDSLLALSKLSSQPLARQPVNLSQLAGFIAEDLTRLWPGRDLAFEVMDGMQVWGDPTLLRVVLENLLGNAWKYTSQCEHAQIRFARAADDRATFTVADNGAGFDMRFADRLFGVFQRLHSASEFAGTGVGLASVRRIIRRHGGEIWADSEVAGGARFHFTLPGR